MAAFVEENWQIARSTVRERTKFMFNNNLLSDVTFKVRSSNGSTVEIPAHKFMLSISSPVFHAMFYGQMAETSDTIELPDSEYDGLLELFRYIYSEEVFLSRSCVMQVLYLAEKYILPSLVNQCFEYLRENVDESNVLCILTHALRYSEQNKDLVERCWTVIDNHTEQAVQSDEFVTIDKSILEALVERDSLNIQEIELFKAVNIWAEYQCEMRGLVADGCMKRNVIGKGVVSKIRFPVMGKTEFASVVLDSDILLAHEAFDLTRCYYSPSVFPRGFLSTKRIGGLKHCQRFDSVVNFGWIHYDKEEQFFFLLVDKPINIHGVRLFGSGGERQEVTLDVRDFSANVVFAHKKGTFASIQLQYNSASFYGFDVLFDQPANLQEEIVYCVRVSITGSVSWCGENVLNPVQCSGVTFSFSTNNKMTKSLTAPTKYPKDCPAILFTLE